jgi:Ni/Fe-hydrogenase subunit HybB-like protein
MVNPSSSAFPTAAYSLRRDNADEQPEHSKPQDELASQADYDPLAEEQTMPIGLILIVGVMFVALVFAALNVNS